MEKKVNEITTSTLKASKELLIRFANATPDDKQIISINQFLHNMNREAEAEFKKNREKSSKMIEGALKKLRPLKKIS